MKILISDCGVGRLLIQESWIMRGCCIITSAFFMEGVQVPGLEGVDIHMAPVIEVDRRV